MTGLTHEQKIELFDRFEQELEQKTVADMRLMSNTKIGRVKREKAMIILLNEKRQELQLQIPELTVDSYRSSRTHYNDHNEESENPYLKIQIIKETNKFNAKFHSNIKPSIFVSRAFKNMFGKKASIPAPSNSNFNANNADESKAAESANAVGAVGDVILDPLLAQNMYPREALAKCHSDMSEFMCEELFDELKELKSVNGFTLAQAINTGVKNPQSLTGIHAGDIESYTVFGGIFDKVINKYHGMPAHGQSLDAKVNFDVNKITAKINAQNPITSTRIQVLRNIQGFPLAPGQNSVIVKLSIEALMHDVFATFQDNELLKGRYHPLTGMSDAMLNNVVKKLFFYVGNDDPMQRDSGYHKWGTQGRGIYISDNHKFVVWVNEGDHLRIISMEKSGDVRGVFERLGYAINAIEAATIEVSENQNKGFMKNEKLGHITCCPTNLGTGLRANVHIYLPRLCEQGLEKLNGISSEFRIQIRRFYNNVENNGIVEVSNKSKMCYPEYGLVQTMVEGLNRMIQLELELELENQNQNRNRNQNQNQARTKPHKWTINEDIWLNQAFIGLNMKFNNHFACERRITSNMAYIYKHKLKITKI